MRADLKHMQIQVLQEQAKRPAQVARALPEPAAAPTEERLDAQHPGGGGPVDRDNFHGLPSGATSFTGLAELVASDRSASQAGMKLGDINSRCRPCDLLCLLCQAAPMCHAINHHMLEAEGARRASTLSCLGKLTQAAQA